MTGQVRAESAWWVTGHSSYLKNVRVVAFVLRYIDKLRKKTLEGGTQLTRKEVNRAELKIFKFVQDEVFPEKSNVISGVRVERDKDGLIRVLTKLVYRRDTIDFRYPVLLSTSHPLVEMFIREEHRCSGHAGTQFLMGKLREKCWIVHGRRAIKRIVKSCVICRRFATKSPTVPSAPLPEDRVKNASAFDVTGVDLAGPLVLKDRSKCWIVLFTCAVYRCVHLELVQSLTTEDFLLAFIRFSKRKRRPKIVYSDNGTNFVGSVNLFKSIDWKEVELKTGQMRIQWRFNPPSAPWWGGWWERLIRSMKDQLKRMLGFGKLTFVQLETCLCEVESVINGRPLTYVTEDQDDLIPLTPAMFIYDLPNSECPEAELLNVDKMQANHRNLKQLFEELGSRFRKEYLSQLVQRGKDKKHEQFKVGDVVLVGADNKKRVQWCMARILELIAGKDGKYRVAKVKTATGELVRPLQRLYPLEVSAQESTSVPLLMKPAVTVDEGIPSVSNPAAKTRCGRVVNRPIKYRST